VDVVLVLIETKDDGIGRGFGRRRGFRGHGEQFIG
jgi:hypothetical protein